MAQSNNEKVLSQDFYLKVYRHTSKIKIEKVPFIEGVRHWNRFLTRILGLIMHWMRFE